MREIARNIDVTRCAVAYGRTVAHKHATILGGTVELVGKHIQ